ncbi:VWA domain-containing protein, partial [Candidatus Kaiserbacteria bacterium]|nr:VWA domain-containing protein [Candidatus Kaiserbacteria bacterium]
GVLIFYINFYQPANCFDLVMNGHETGIDCGGSCVRICAAGVSSPQVVWTESFKITEGQYNAVAYIENKNQIAATPELNYKFQLLNNGIVVAERSGTTVLPPNSSYPIFEGKILTDSRQEVTETKIILEPVDMWIPATVGYSQFRSQDIKLSSSDFKPRLDVKLENTELTPANNVEVVATIFNESGRPVTASKTFTERIEARSSKDLVFTWPSPIAKTVKSCEIPTDVMIGIDVSGSMNNDGDNPPQPITDVIGAASRFVNSLKEKDQVSVVTFATRAETITRLTNLHGAVANAVQALSISPVEEHGFTNTSDALTTAQTELNSERHNQDARRVLVILTDGLPTESGDEDAVAKAITVATELNENGIEVYAIGLGKNVDQTFIKAIASDESNAYFAPTGNDLEAIYKEITTSLCEVGPTKIDVIAKTKTNFTPLR